MKLIKDLFVNNLSQGLQFGSQWFLNIAILNILGLEYFGNFSFYYAISNFLMPILPFGSYVFLMKDSFHDDEQANRAFTISFQLQLLFFIIISLSCLVFYADTTNYLLLILALLNGYLLSLNTLIYIFHKSLGDFKLELFSNFFKSALITILIISVFYFKFINVSVLLIALIMINSLTICLGFIRSKVIISKNIESLFKISFKAIKERIKVQKYYGIQEILTVSFVQGGMLLLPLFIADEEYGIYRGVLLLVAPFALLNLTFSQVLLNQIKGVSDQQKAKVFHSLQKIALPILLVILITLFFLRSWILQIILKIEIDSTLGIVYIGVLSIIFFSFVYSGYEMLLVALNKQKIRFYIMVVGAVVNLISIFCLLPQFGIIGAIGTNVISTFVVFLLLFISGEKQLKNK